MLQLERKSQHSEDHCCGMVGGKWDTGCDTQWVVAEARARTVACRAALHSLWQLGSAQLISGSWWLHSTYPNPNPNPSPDPNPDTNSVTW